MDLSWCVYMLNRIYFFVYILFYFIPFSIHFLKILLYPFCIHFVSIFIKLILIPNLIPNLKSNIIGYFLFLSNYFHTISQNLFCIQLFILFYSVIFSNYFHTISQIHFSNPFCIQLFILFYSVIFSILNLIPTTETPKSYTRKEYKPQVFKSSPV